MPAKLQDYVVDMTSSIVLRMTPTSLADSGVYYPLTHYVSYEKFSTAHRAFLGAISFVYEPKHFSQAVKDPRWHDAMSAEIAALEANNTWSLESLPPGKHALDSKWVYKVKYKPDGTLQEKDQIKMELATE